MDVGRRPQASNARETGTGEERAAIANAELAQDARVPEARKCRSLGAPVRVGQAGCGHVKAPFTLLLSRLCSAIGRKGSSHSPWGGGYLCPPLHGKTVLIELPPSVGEVKSGFGSSVPVSGSTSQNLLSRSRPAQQPESLRMGGGSDQEPAQLLLCSEHVA